MWWCCHSQLPLLHSTHICKSSSASCPGQPSHTLLHSRAALLHPHPQSVPGPGFTAYTRTFLGPSDSKGHRGEKGPMASLCDLCKEGVRLVWLTQWTKQCLGRKMEQREITDLPVRQGSEKRICNKTQWDRGKRLATWDSNLSLYLRGRSAQVFSEPGTLYCPGAATVPMDLQPRSGDGPCFSKFMFLWRKGS